jgi:hypothetical protein
VEEARRRGIALIGPLLAGTSAQARAGNGYARADFTIDYDARAVTCPQGRTSISWSPCTQHGKDKITVKFSPGDCGPCPARDLCFTSSSRNRRQLTLNPRGLAEVQAANREQGEDHLVPGRLRPPRRDRGHHAPGRQPRRPPRALPKTRLEHAFMAVALNLIRLHAYWSGTPLDRRRTTHLARLELDFAA